jgi:RNA-binding protein 25
MTPSRISYISNFP